MDKYREDILDRGIGYAKKVYFCILLKKNMKQEEESELDRNIKFNATLLLTIGLVLASFYEGMPRIISTYGYMIFFPLLVSGIMSFITSVCFAELVTLNPNSGGSYRYVYYTMGELMGFLVGWSCICTSVMQVCEKTIMMTQNIDLSLFDGRMSNFTSKYLSIGGFENYFLRILPNAELENIILILAVIGVSILGVRKGIFVVYIIALFNILIICSCITIFWFYMDLSKFNILGATEDFTFFTEGSVEGHLFYMNFEVAIFGGAETVKPTTTIPRGLVEGFHIGFMFYMVSVILYSARKGAAEKNTTEPDMKNALWNLGFKTFSVLPPIGLVLCYFLSAIAEIFEATRVMYTMANDGLMFPIFGKAHRRFPNHFNSHIFLAVVCCLVGVFIGVAPSTKWAIIAMETSIRIMVLIAYLVLRYQCDSEDLSLEEYALKKRWVLTNFPHALNKPTKTTHTISMLLIFLSVISIILSELIMIFFIIGTNNTLIFLRIGFVICILTAFISVQLLNQQPVNSRKYFLYKVRGIPFTPMLAITWYSLILMFLPPYIWVKIFCWYLLGLLFYFSYACLRSVEYRKHEAVGEVER
ncbi:unnamed protein product [Nezara viridula]|uniref:Amino acid permease/ SLC12A domain-containing protein n=1 Tax=Nezara viridula TaxID=85310 RepID=A0A9P0MJ47_NEZVI|nr:unnamed protein product [Nezara viridula]